MKWLKSLSLKAQGLIAIVLLMTTISGFLTNGFGLLSDVVHTAEAKERMLKSFIENEDAEKRLMTLFLENEAGLEAFLQVPDILSHMVMNKKRNDSLVRIHAFISSQSLNILFSLLTLVEERDNSGGYYYFRENPAGDYWIKVDGNPYIVQYQASEDYWYYVTFPNKDFIRIKSVTKRIMNTNYQHDYTQDDLEELGNELTL